MISASKYIAQDKLTTTLDELAKQYVVWVPVAAVEQQRVVRFMPYENGMEPILAEQSGLGPKNVLLPQVEPLLTFDFSKDADDPAKQQLRLEAPEPPKLSLIFGARPCDARGFLIFDQVFSLGPYVDDIYTARREQTLIATLVCLDEDSACFCSSVGSGPADMDGSDIRLTPISGGYVAEALNDKAQPVMELLAEAASEMQLAAARKVQEEAAQRKVGRADLTRSRESFLERFQDMHYWREMVGPCLSCGICTYVCPTCYCFSITDEMRKNSGERIRSWDSCMFYTYTLEASGHNPRPTRLERYRNRVGHKFSYFPEKYQGMIACCGCGRCIRSCPVSIDIRRVTENLKEKSDVCA